MFALVLPVSMWHHFLMAKSMKKVFNSVLFITGSGFLKKKCGCGTEGHGSVVALAPQLASMWL